MVYCLHELIQYLHKYSPQTPDGITVHWSVIENSLFFFFAKQFAAFRTDSTVRSSSVKLSDVIPFNVFYIDCLLLV